MRLVIWISILIFGFVLEPQSALAQGADNRAYLNSFDAERGTGEFKPARGSILRSAKAPPLASLGPDAFRFSTEPALGGPGMVFLVYPKDEQFAVATVEFFSGHNQVRWTKTGSLSFSMSKAQYDQLTTAVDLELSKKVQKFDPSGEIIVCTDGPGYLTERRHGETKWLSGFCNENPNNEISNRVEEVIVEWISRPAHGRR